MKHVSRLLLPMTAALIGCLGSGAGPTGAGSSKTGTGGSVTTGAGGSTAIGAGGATTPGDGGSTTPGTGGSSSPGLGGSIGAGVGGSSTSGAGGSAPTGAGGAGASTAAGGSTTAGTGLVDWGNPVAGGPTGSGVAAAVTVAPSTIRGTVAADFVGFSYEKSHIVNGSLTGANAKLIALYKLIGSPMMRLGADDADVCTWNSSGTAPTSIKGQLCPTVNVVPAMVDQLCDFLAATKTQVIYAVNFKADKPATSSAETAYVMSKCPSSIYGFEIGNEIDKYGSWTGQQGEWESFATMILAKSPAAVLVGPASTGSGFFGNFTAEFAASEAAKFPLVLLTQHFYPGSAGSSNATAASLQTINANLPAIASGMKTLVTTDKIPKGYRFDETNTFSHHGQMGVSDTLIAGLWAIDLMGENANNGSSGVNFHGGETGMDGTVPFYYEPIMELAGAVVQVQPVYYGMLLFALAGQGAAVSTSITPSNPDFTAYAIKASGFTSVILDNKNASNGVSATVDLGAAVASASAVYLQGTPAGALTAAATTVTLAGAGVTPAGAWNPQPPYRLTASGNTFSIYVPAGSAALVHVPQ